MPIRWIARPFKASFGISNSVSLIKSKTSLITRLNSLLDRPKFPILARRELNPLIREVLDLIRETELEMPKDALNGRDPPDRHPGP